MALSRRKTPLAVFTVLFLVVVTLFVSIAPIYAVAAPVVAVNVPPTTLLNENFTFTVTFDNVGADPGFGPFLDVILPAAGIDGNDGITFVAASYLGNPIAGTLRAFPSNGCLGHPFAVDTTFTPLSICGRPGDQLVVLQLPFGSFTPLQPPIEVDITAFMSPLADLNAPLGIFARGGFRFGNDALNNPCCDPPLLSPNTPNSGAWPGAPTAPVIIEPSKAYLGPSDEGEAEFTDPPNETVTGPNANGEVVPIRYEIVVDVAAGQSLDNVNVTDLLPAGMLFDQLISASPVGSNPGVGPIIPQNTNLVVTWPTPIVGTTVPDDIRLVVQVFVSNVTTGGVPVQITNQSTINADWQSPDPRDSLGAVGIGGAANAPVIVARALAMQKSSVDLNAGDLIAGDRLRYGLEFQVSDYFAFDDVTITDILSDGLVIDMATVRLTLTGGGLNIVNAAFNPANITTTNNPDGSTTVVFRVSDEAGVPLRGGCIPAAGIANPDCVAFNSGQLTQGTVVFEVDISDVFTATFPSGDPSVDQGDGLRNQATITGQSLDPATFAPQGFSASDNSLETLTIARSDLSKSIYALNGTICGACTGIEAETGDTLTYRIRYESPSSDFENLLLTDFLPLPIFDVNDPDGNGAPGPIWAFDGVTVSNLAPPSGTIWFTTGDTYEALFPALNLPVFTVNAPNNGLTFDYGTQDDPLNRPSVMELLFTVTVTGDPYADGLSLANQMSATEGSTNAGASQAEAIAALESSEPLLALHKGVIGTDNPDAVLTAPTGPVTFSPPGSGGIRWTGIINSDGLDGTDIDADVSGVDPGDTISFAIVIENVGEGSRGAFDVRIRDILPPGFVVPPGGLNLTVTRGDGTTVSFTLVGTGLFDPNGGIELVDPNPNQGVCATFNPTNGQNIVVITYDLMVDQNAVVPSGLRNTASLTQFANFDGFGATANYVDSREGLAFSNTADTIVGFLSAGGTGSANELAGVTHLPATGQSPISKWRAALLLWFTALATAILMRLSEYTLGKVKIS